MTLVGTSGRIGRTILGGMIAGETARWTGTPGWEMMVTRVDEIVIEAVDGQETVVGN